MSSPEASPQQQRIATLTLNSSIDKSSEVDSVAAEIKLRCSEPDFHPGGGGINVSRAIHRLAGHSTAFYTAGGGPGQIMSELLASEQLDHRAISIKGWTRETLTIFERSTTLQYRFGMPGPQVQEDEWRRALNDVIDSDADIIVGSGSIPPGVPTDIYAQLSRRAAAVGKRVIVDTSGDALQAIRGAGVYLAKPNLSELQAMTGSSFDHEHEIRQMARKAIQQGLAEVLAISMGGSGAILITADDDIFMRAPIVPIKSKVGAGDSMVAGLTLALARGADLHEALRWGVAAGTAAVMTPGTELCHLDDTRRLYEQLAG